jgi:hypothetical protein
MLDISEMTRQYIYVTHRISAWNGDSKLIISDEILVTVGYVETDSLPVVLRHSRNCGSTRGIMLLFTHLGITQTELQIIATQHQ